MNLEASRALCFRLVVFGRDDLDFNGLSRVFESCLADEKDLNSVASNLRVIDASEGSRTSSRLSICLWGAKSRQEGSGFKVRPGR
jgi:hypothetical protein